MRLLENLARNYLVRQLRRRQNALRQALPPSPEARQDASDPSSFGNVGRWQNPRSGLGGYQDKAVGSIFVPSIRLDRTILDSLYEFDAMTGRIVDREPDDAIRKGIKLKGFERFGESQVLAVTREIARLGLLDAVADARRWARLYGGGAVIVAVDDGVHYSEPLNLPGLRKLRGVFAADRHDVTPARYDHEPGSSTFGEPLAYYVGDSASGGTPALVHASRVIRFHGVRLPPRVQIQNQGWGGSVVDRVWTALRNWSVSHEYAANIIGEFTQGVYKIKGLADMLSDDDEADLVARLEVIRMAQSIIGHIALDAEGEGFEKLTTNVTGLKDLLESFVAALVAVTEMPRTVLLGEQPAGLGASADSEIRVWYDHVASQQTKIYTEPLLLLLTLMLRASLGPTGGVVPEGELFEWEPLWQPSKEEASKTRQANAAARASDVQNGIVSPDEARRDPEVRELYQLEDDELAPAAEPEEAEEAETPELEAERQESINAPPPGETLLDAREIGRRLGVSARSVVNMHRRGEIDAWRIGGRWRFAYSQVLDVASRRVALGGGT